MVSHNHRKTFDLNLPEFSGDFFLCGEDEVESPHLVSRNEESMTIEGAFHGFYRCGWWLWCGAWLRLNKAEEVARVAKGGGSWVGREEGREGESVL
ncbi:hypothetical protein ACE6H2_006505 [Prunus campanulata]